MAKDDKTNESKVISLQDWKNKKDLKGDRLKEYTAKHRQVIKLWLNSDNLELLKEVKGQVEVNKTDREIFLRGLSVLNQYLKLLANGGQLFLITNDSTDELAMEFDFE